MKMLQTSLLALGTIINLSATSATIREGDDPMKLLRYLYMNYGATQQVPNKFDCKSWVDLFAENATWNTPSFSVAHFDGAHDLSDNCTAFEEQFAQLTAFEEAAFPIFVENKPFVAFAWRIAGVLNNSGSAVSIPAITTWNLDDDSKILSAVDYYDLTGVAAQDDTQLQLLRYRYMNFGATKQNPDQYNCTSWVELFSVNGSAQGPSFLPSHGTAGLTDYCTGFQADFLQITAFEEAWLPVGNAGHPKRVAFSWRIAGVLASGGAISIPAITTWHLDDDLKIVSASDYYDAKLLIPFFESRADQPTAVAS